MRALTIAVFIILATAMLVLAAVGRTRPSLVAPVSALLDRVCSERAARVAVTMFWWWLAWHFLVARTVDTPPSGLG